MDKDISSEITSNIDVNDLSISVGDLSSCSSTISGSTYSPYYVYDGLYGSTVSDRIEDIVLDTINYDEGIRGKFIEKVLESPKMKEDYDLVLHYVRDYLEKLLDSPQDIFNEIRELKEENSNLRRELEQIKKKLCL